jgi:hypothetical protein
MTEGNSIIIKDYSLTKPVTVFIDLTASGLYFLLNKISCKARSAASAYLAREIVEKASNRELMTNL